MATMPHPAGDPTHQHSVARAYCVACGLARTSPVDMLIELPNGMFRCARHVHTELTPFPTEQDDLTVPQE